MNPEPLAHGGAGDEGGPLERLLSRHEMADVLGVSVGLIDR
jgi:hypothetical protein